MADAVAAAEPAGRKLTLESSDHEVYEVEESVAMASRTIRHMVEENWASDIIPLPNVHSSILAKVIVYCKEHAHKGGADADATDAPAKASGPSLKAFDDKFLDVHQNVLFDLLLAANYLNIKALLDLTCQKVADMMKGKTLEQIRETFNIKNDLTKEEEEEIRKENQWAFD